MQTVEVQTAEIHTADEFITAQEACALLGLTPITLCRLTIPEGIVPQVAPVGPHDAYRLVFTRADIEKISSLEKITGMDTTAPERRAASLRS